MRKAIFKMRSRTIHQTKRDENDHQPDASLRSEIIALWAKAGMEIDSTRLSMFDRMSPSFQREIVENARDDVRSLSTMEDKNEREGSART